MKFRVKIDVVFEADGIDDATEKLAGHLLSPLDDEKELWEIPASEIELLPPSHIEIEPIL